MDCATAAEVEDIRFQRRNESMCHILSEREHNIDGVDSSSSEESQDRSWRESKDGLVSILRYKRSL